MTIHSSHRNGLSHDTAIGSALSQSIHNKPKYHGWERASTTIPPEAS